MPEKELKLNQVIAIANGEKSRAKKVWNKVIEIYFFQMIFLSPSIEENSDLLGRERSGLKTRLRFDFFKINKTLEYSVLIDYIL